MWYKLFKEGRKDVDDGSGAGHPSKFTTYENLEVEKKIVIDNCRIAAKELVADVGICLMQFF